MALTSTARTALRVLIGAWGIGGVVALLSRAVWRLTPFALEPIRSGMTPSHVALYASWVLFNLYAEGYRGFHRGFSPRVVARAVHLSRNPQTLHVLLAPAYCMSLLHATRRGMITAWSVLVAIVAVVAAVRLLPQPWRGIVDGGVVVGLLAGTLSILWFTGLSLAGRSVKTRTHLPLDPNRSSNDQP